MRLIVIAVVSALIAETAPAVEWVKKPELTFDEKAQKWYVTFELDTFSDVEVAIVDPAKYTVVRHLAAGVLGPKVPPPLTANSRSQRLEWDGKDDYGVKVIKPESLAVRVRAGMSVALEQIVGGEAKSIAVELQRPLEILDAKRNEADAGFHSVIHQLALP